MGCISSSGSSVAGAVKRGHFGGGDLWWSLGHLCRHLDGACAPVSCWAAMRWRVTCFNSTTCFTDKRKRAAHLALYIDLQSCSRLRIHNE